MLSATEIVWQPNCGLTQLQLRAQLLNVTRAFFAERGVLEVETPLLGTTTTTDPQLAFFATQYQFADANQTLFLQTSPEFAMKRLLAAGSGSIYQICKAFRNGENGRLHHPEFTLLEWYRVGFDLSQLMAEVAALFKLWFGATLNVTTLSYAEVFRHYTGLDALNFDVDSYQTYALKQQLIDALRLCGIEHRLWLDFLFSHCIQPQLGTQGLVMVYGYPACQAALAKLNAQDPRVAERVEVFMQGLELGNGFFELDDALEQAQRFTQEQQQRQQLGLSPVAQDSKLLAALNSGLPACAGIAIGLDRVLMLRAGGKHIAEVLSFAYPRI